MKIEICLLCEAEKVLADETTVPAVFCRNEVARLASFRVPKRRREWAAGRLAAKRLIQDRLLQDGRWRALNDIEIAVRPCGRPYALLAEWPASEENHDPYPISITHSRDRAMAALGPQGTLIGIDLEAVVHRDPAWIDVFMHPSESTPALASSVKSQTALWTLKEAVLKVLGLGLTADLHDVRFVPDGNHGPRLELHGLARRRWDTMGAPRISFTVEVHHDFCFAVASTLGGKAAPAPDIDDREAEWTPSRR